MAGERGEQTPVALFEDDKTRREVLTEFLDMSGYMVALEAGDMQQALQIIDQFKEANIVAALIDGNLNDDVSGDDGERIVFLIQEKAPSVKTLGISFSRAGVRGADKNISGLEGSSAVVRALTELLTS